MVATICQMTVITLLWINNEAIAANWVAGLPLKWRSVRAIVTHLNLTQWVRTTVVTERIAIVTLLHWIDNTVAAQIAYGRLLF